MALVRAVADGRSAPALAIVHSVRAVLTVRFVRVATMARVREVVRPASLVAGNPDGAKNLRAGHSESFLATDDHSSAGVLPLSSM